eukprot:CAMPEP_0176355078 /NCGR_PEP_ID=MMETSP0126-20121128/13036_1 /TAXON_ID=141414 ORGANISM="Strombidinopsis acuminatum, Strain SPMC142" /NCGR_SAMPLE_ID=MMETSP0126 /ASSEMBLY_ACC=CAM_ASM_000229 /LENGTH=79 /DNA_ID=CAMNT_0017707571 /DNA_START=1480 /DNA_END=1719 /DNA_ORIENTATION=+
MAVIEIYSTKKINPNDIRLIKGAFIDKEKRDKTELREAKLKIKASKKCVDTDSDGEEQENLIEKKKTNPMYKKKEQTDS